MFFILLTIKSNRIPSIRNTVAIYQRNLTGRPLYTVIVSPIGYNML